MKNILVALILTVCSSAANAQFLVNRLANKGKGNLQIPLFLIPPIPEQNYDKNFWSQKVVRVPSTSANQTPLKQIVFEQINKSGEADMTESYSVIVDGHQVVSMSSAHLRQNGKNMSLVVDNFSKNGYLSCVESTKKDTPARPKCFFMNLEVCNKLAESKNKNGEISRDYKKIIASWRLPNDENIKTIRKMFMKENFPTSEYIKKPTVEELSELRISDACQKIDLIVAAQETGSKQESPHSSSNSSSGQ